MLVSLIRAILHVISKEFSAYLLTNCSEGYKLWSKSLALLPRIALVVHPTIASSAEFVAPRFVAHAHPAHPGSAKGLSSNGIARALCNYIFSFQIKFDIRRDNFKCPSGPQVRPCPRAHRPSMRIPRPTSRSGVHAPSSHRAVAPPSGSNRTRMILLRPARPSSALVKCVARPRAPPDATARTFRLAAP